MALSPYPIDPALTAIAVAYQNPLYIADAILPRIRVDKQKFSFMQYATDTFFNVPDTRVGRRGKPNEVNLEGTEVTDSTEDFALDGGVPKADEENADPRYDPLGNEVMLLNELIALDRERRAVAVVQAAGTYDASLRVTLAGAGQFSDYVNSDPVNGILAYLDMPLVRPNQMVLSQEGWTKLRSHPKLVSAIRGTAVTSGAVSRAEVADLFEIQEILVGTARSNTVKRGQAPALSRLWGKHISLLYKHPTPEVKGAVTFGGSFQWGDRIASQWEDRNMGMRGGTAVRTGESLRERVIAPQAGYFIQSAFA